MADDRRRHLRRNGLILLGSFVGHVIAFFVAIANFQFYPPPPLEAEQPMEVQVVPPPAEMPPPPPPIIITKQQIAPTPTPPSPPPTPTPTPQPRPQPTPSPPQPAPQPAPAPTSPAPQTARPTLTPAPKPAPAPTPSPLAPPVPAPAPGPPRAVSVSSLTQPQTHTVNAPHLVLHRDRNENAGQPTVAIPGAVFAPTPQAQSGQPPGAATAPGGGPPGGGPPGPGFPGGALPGFGNGLRGSLLGCANAEALHLSAAERSHCAETFGEGTRQSPQMNPIDSSKRTVLDSQAASEAATQRYRNSTPSGSEATPVAGQPRGLTAPGP